MEQTLIQRRIEDTVTVGRGYDIRYSVFLGCDEIGLRSTLYNMEMRDAKDVLSALKIHGSFFYRDFEDPGATGYGIYLHSSNHNLIRDSMIRTTPVNPSPDYDLTEDF